MAKLQIENNILLKCILNPDETTFTIPDSVTSIGAGAFKGCSGLTSIIIPDSVTSIGDDAFESCTGLTSIIIPDSVTSIGDGAFRDCSGLTFIIIPESVTSIGRETFERCSGLTSVTIPDSVTGVGSWAFRGCIGLTSVTIPDSVTSFGLAAFFCCRSLTQVTIPDSVTSISKDAFYNCSGLTSVTIPNSVTSIGYEAFKGCSGLTSVTIPNSVTSIGYEAFMGCSGLTYVSIPDSVKTIGDAAFMECTNIRAIQIAAGLDLARLRRVLPSVTEFQVEPRVTREELYLDIGYSPKSIKGKGSMQFAKLLFLCGERIARINGAEEISSPMSTKGPWGMQRVFAKLFGVRSVAKLPTLPPEIWLEIMSWVYIEPVPKKVKPISSDALLLTDDERKRVDQYKQSFKMVDSEDAQVIDSVIIIGAIAVAVSALAYPYMRDEEGFNPKV